MQTSMNEASDKRHPHYGKRENVGAYLRPYSGVGEEFEPIEAAQPELGFVLHETGYWAKNREWNFLNVYSPFWRILFDFEPGHHVRFGQELTPLGPDRVLVIPDHQRFDCLGDFPLPELWFHFSCVRNADPAQPRPIIVPMDDVITAFTEAFPPLFRSHAPDRHERIRQLSLPFVQYILIQPQIRWQETMPEQVEKVKAMINADPAEPWNNSLLAKAAHMSKSGFIRCFSEWMHTTPARYVQQVRIREASRLLSTTDNSIKRISTQVGFANRYHFSRIFTAHTGTSPATYRRQHLNSPKDDSSAR